MFGVYSLKPISLKALTLKYSWSSQGRQSHVIITDMASIRAIFMIYEMQRSSGVLIGEIFDYNRAPQVCHTYIGISNRPKENNPRYILLLTLSYVAAHDVHEYYYLCLLLRNIALKRQCMTKATLRAQNGILYPRIINGCPNV